MTEQLSVASRRVFAVSFVVALVAAVAWVAPVAHADGSYPDPPPATPTGLPWTGTVSLHVQNSRLSGVGSTEMCNYFNSFPPLPESIAGGLVFWSSCSGNEDIGATLVSAGDEDELGVQPAIVNVAATGSAQFADGLTFCPDSDPGNPSGFFGVYVDQAASFSSPTNPVDGSFFVTTGPGGHGYQVGVGHLLVPAGFTDTVQHPEDVPPTVHCPGLTGNYSIGGWTSDLQPDPADACHVVGDFSKSWSGGGMSMHWDLHHTAVHDDDHNCIEDTVPGAAKIGSAVPGNGRATLHWTAPTSTGGSPITGYVVTPYKAGVAAPDRVLNSTSTTATLAGLANAKRYTFKVAATNARGTGAKSKASVGITIGAPNQPTAVQATKTSVGALKVAFKAPGNNGATIVRYSATCKSSNGGVSKSTTGKASPIKLTGLTPNKRYTCTVTATNSRGTGPASAPSAAVQA